MKIEDYPILYDEDDDTYIMVECMFVWQEILSFLLVIQGVFLHLASPKMLKYGVPRLGESTST